MSAGFGSPCGACKFLRRKCVQGCVFAPNFPYFCHEQRAAHFAAIHKVFGASNASKLLAHLPAPDRSEAALTISYEAQAHLQDPIYGCVAHISALQQQIVNLQAQLASLKARTAQGLSSGSTSTPSHGLDERTMQAFLLNPSMNFESILYYNDSGSQTNISNDIYMPVGIEEGSSSVNGQASFDTEDLQSVAYAYLQNRR